MQLVINENKRSISDDKLKSLIEAALFISEKPLSVEHMRKYQLSAFSVTSKRVHHQLIKLQEEYVDRGVNLVELASGFQYQTSKETSQVLAEASIEKPHKYSRALLETLALIAYKQPITRGEIEDVRGVSVSSQIMKTLTEREWVKVVGHKEVPGRPALYATTEHFLDYFSLNSLEQLPELMPIADSAINEGAG